jgi:cytoskeletal protein CcmA (bactofilin family)
MFKKATAENLTGDPRIKRATALPASPVRNQDPTPIDPSLHISGHIRGEEDLIVYGHVEGTINIGEGLLIVAKQGQVDADVTARVITVEGRVEGTLVASEQIIVRRCGRVRGSISAPRIALDFGCAFSGSIETNVGEESSPANRDGKIADFKSAISNAGDAPARSAMRKGSPR